MSDAKKPRTEKRGLLERLAAGEVVIGDGGYVFALEKRGYVKAGPWTPEATVEYPDAVRQLAREFLRAGSDVMQAFTFYGSDDKLENRGNVSQKKHTGSAVNDEACKIAQEVANEGNALVTGGVSQTPNYLSGSGKEAVQEQFRKQAEVFIKNDVDFLLAEVIDGSIHTEQLPILEMVEQRLPERSTPERALTQYFEHVEEAVWAVEELKKTSKPVAASLCIGPEGDLHGVSAGDCAVKLAKAGADVVGLNCHFGPDETLQTIRLMKAALDKEGLKPYLMTQPLGFKTPDVNKQGFIDLPEFPFGLEPRIVTRWDCHKYARDAYNIGVRYIGACCGMEPYHVRAIAEELSEERGCLPAGSEKHGLWGDGLRQHTKPWVRARARRDYWENLKPASGRPDCPLVSKPDSWGVTQGDKDLLQKTDETTDAELKDLFKKK